MASKPWRSKPPLTPRPSPLDPPMPNLTPEQIDLLTRLQGEPTYKPITVTFPASPQHKPPLIISQPNPAKAEDDVAAAKTNESAGKALGKFYSELENEVTARISDAILEQTAALESMVAEMKEAVRTSTAKLEVTVGEITGTITGMRHRQLEDLIKVTAQRLPVMLVGIAGSGKTHAASQVAQALDLKFYSMSVGAQTSKSDIMGFVHAGGSYVRTLFREAYEHGGVFLMDEIDAGNANVLIQVNAALSNDYCAFPDQMVAQHPAFTFVASANTFGNGANRQYVGRNQLDAATLDRFVLMEWEIDSKLEEQLAGDGREAKQWFAAVQKIRERVAAEGMRVLVTPRATLRGARLITAGVPIPQAANTALFNLFPADKRDWARTIAREEIKC